MSASYQARFNWENMSLMCEWGTCQTTHCRVNHFHHHVQQHLKDYPEDQLTCQWKDCRVTLITHKEFKRHVYFHVFHTKIKCFGENHLERQKLGKCSIDPAGRNMIPDLPQALICYWADCLMEFDSVEFFYRHADLHAEPDDPNVKKMEKARCQWLGCNSYVPNSYKLREHLRSHTQERMVACPTCGAMFTSRTKLKDHMMRQVSPSKKSFTCEYCGKQASTERLLKDHMRHHVNHYKCPHCNMTCSTPSALQSHIVYRHSEDKPYACPRCDHRAKSEHDIKKHLGNTHSDKFQCPISSCDYVCKSFTTYSRHLRVKHENQKAPIYMCHLCSESFKRGNGLTKHLISAHNFKWPSGHCRFRYHLHKDGIFRLQTVRYESMELFQKMQQRPYEEDAEDEEEVDNPQAVS